MQKFIIDKEVNLNENDLLQTKEYAQSLVRAIENTEPNKVFTIGLFGSWGSGKSSIIETARLDLEKSNMKVVTYDAWQYANDSFRRMFLLKLSKELNLEQTALLKKFYENESTDVNNKFQLSGTKVLWILAAILILLLIFWVIPIKIETKMPLYGIFTIIGLFVSVISGAFHHLKISISKPLMFAPEQFEACFNEMSAISLTKHSKIKEFLYILKGDKTVRDLDRLIIVIDNIDRCTNEVAYSLLTDVKTFLGTTANSIVFVIPVDDEALRKHLFSLGRSKDKEESIADKEEFLRKFFNLTMRIKPFQETDMFSYAKNLNKTYQLNFNNETINIASKEYSTNPRRVIQLFNNLNLELSNYSPEFSIRNETLICAILILREEFGTYYKHVLKAPSTLANRNTAMLEDKTEFKSTVDRFLRIAQSVFKNASLDDLNIVLTNTNNIFSSISTEIKDSIVTFDVDSVLKFYKEDAENILDFIVYCVKLQSKHGLKDDLLAYFEMVTYLDDELPIKRYINSQLNEVFEEEHLFYIQNIDDFSKLCKYALKLEGQGLNGLKAQIIQIVNIGDVELPFWRPLFNEAIRHFNDSVSSKSLSNRFKENYHLFDSTDVTLNAIQFNHLVTDDLVIGLIDSIVESKNYLVENNSLINIFANKHNLKAASYDYFFKRIIDVNPDRFLYNDVLALLKLANSFLFTLRPRQMEKEYASLQNFYQLVFGDLYKDDADHPGVPAYYTEVTIIEEAEKDEKVMEVIVDFLKNTYRAARGKIKILDELYELEDKRFILNEMFIKLKNEGFKLGPIDEFIYSDKNFDSESTIELLSYLMLNSHNGKSEEKIETIKSKVNELFEYANKTASQKVIDLLVKVSENELFKDSIVDLIVSQPTETINRQPEKLLKLAIGAFNSDTYNEFKNNYSFLKVIAANGNQAQNHYLVSILNHKIDNSDSILLVLDIIENINSIKGTDKALLRAHLRSFEESNGAEMDEETKLALKNVIESLAT